MVRITFHRFTISTAEYLKLSGGIFSPFMQMYLTWGHSTWALASGGHPLFKVSFSSMYRNTDHWLLKLPPTHWLSLGKDTRQRPREELRWGPPVQYLNNRSHGQNLRSIPCQAEHIAQYFFKSLTTVLYNFPCTMTSPLGVPGDMFHPWTSTMRAFLSKLLAFMFIFG